MQHGEAILRAALHTVGYARGIKYMVEGTRKSGDLDTSSGNSRMTGDVIGSFLLDHIKKVRSTISVEHPFLASSIKWEPEICALENFRMVVLGDDNLMIFRRGFFNKWFGTGLTGPAAEAANIENFKTALKAWCSNLGFTVKVGCTTNCTEAEFVSSRWYPSSVGYAIGKKPGRTLTKIGYHLAKQGRKPAAYAGYLKGTLLSYLNTANHVPFLRIYVWALLDYLSDVTPRYDPQALWRNGGVEPEDQARGHIEATDDTWAAFYQLYGYTEDDERVWGEALIRKLYRYGLPCIVSSVEVKHMFEVDFALA